MKYFSKRQILESLSRLAPVNQFFGLTYLSAKRAGLPVGTAVEISLDALNHELLNEFYSLDPRSKYFFRVFRFNSMEQFWLAPNYHGKGLQKLNTTTFKDAFMHPSEKKWGWKPGYIDFLVSKLPRNSKISAPDLAVWLYRNRAWNENDNRRIIVQGFFKEFLITPEEREKILAEAPLSSISEGEAFQEVPVRWQEIVDEFPSAPDAGPSKGGVLAFLEMEGIGPVSPLRYDPARRLNIITGDNGFGKTFLLEVAWYALTGSWAVRAAYPNVRPGAVATGKIKFQISGTSAGKAQSIGYSKKEHNWQAASNREVIAGLVVYARVDGSYAVFDPAGAPNDPKGQTTLVLNRDQIWDGESGKIEGLVRDWAKWQNNPTKYPFDTFLKVLACLSPPEAKLNPGEPVRLPDDKREIPTVTHMHGDVPIIYESAGIRHIMTLAYLMVWAWNEHRVTAQQFGRRPESRMVVMVDEMEVHLHPKWQRIILPALLKVSEILSSELEMQLHIASHSPLVLASAESVFDSSADKLFHLEESKSGKVRFAELPFLRYGHVDSWLTSNVFELRHARSREAEDVISRAIELQRQEKPTIDAIREVHEKLKKILPSEDEFWPRWVFFAQEHQVIL